MKEFKPYGWTGKGGGTTGANFEAFEKGVYGQIRRRNVPPPHIFTPSAPGRIESDPKSEKLTDYAENAQDALRNGNTLEFDRNIEPITDRFLGMANEANLKVEKYQELLEQYVDALKMRVAHPGLLEIIQGQLLAEYWPNSHFIWPDAVVAVDQYGRINFDKTVKRTREYIADFDQEDVTFIVVPHNGRDRRGHMLELTRNCGDAVGAHMARATHEPYIIFGSTDGISSIDPDRFPDTEPKKIDTLTFKELHTATQGGAFVVHMEGIVPIEQMLDGHMEIRHYLRSEREGTSVVREIKNNPNRNAPRLIAGEVGKRTLHFVRRGGTPEDDYGQLVASALRDLEIPVKRSSSDLQGAIVLTDSNSDLSGDDKKRLKKATGSQSVESDQGMGMITIVGTDFLRSKLKHAANRNLRTFEALSEIDVWPVSITSTGRGSGLTLIVTPDEFNPAMTTLHKKLIESPYVEPDQS